MVSKSNTKGTFLLKLFLISIFARKKKWKQLLQNFGGARQSEVRKNILTIYDTEIINIILSNTQYFVFIVSIM